jgi:hypothetical protein
MNKDISKGKSPLASLMSMFYRCFAPRVITVD